MSLSHFLAAFLGLYLLVMGIVLLVRKQMVGEIARDFIKNRTLIFFAGTISLIGGLLLVLSHNVWEMSWRFLVTLIGYLILFQGLIRIFFADMVGEMSKKFLDKDKFIYVGVILVLLGLFLAYKGFFG